MKRLRSISAQMMAGFLAVFFTALGICTGIMYRSFRRNMEEVTMELARGFSSQIVQNLNNFEEQLDRITRSALLDYGTLLQMDNDKLSMSEKISRQVELRNLLVQVSTLCPDARIVYLLSPGGELYQYSPGGLSIDAATLQSQDWFARAIAKEEPLTIEPLHDCLYEGREAQNIAVTVMRRVKSGRRTVGYLMLDIYPSNIISLSEDFLLARETYQISIHVESEEGLIYASYLANGEEDWKSYTNGEELPVAVYGDSVVISDYTDDNSMRVDVILPRASLFMKLDAVRRLVTVLFAASLAVALLFSGIITGRITRPIRRLQAQMGLAAQGKYEAMSLPGTGNELDDLVESYNYMVDKINRLIHEVYLADIKQKEAQYLALETQINPHMLYNTLESIRMKALLMEADPVADMIASLARMFRAMLNEEKEHTLGDEVDYVEDYVKLQNLRYPGSFSLTVELSDEMRQMQVIPVLLQPLVENAIKHGFNGYGSRLSLQISGAFAVEMEREWLKLRVTDDGNGIEEERLKRINRRLDQNLLERADREEESGGHIGLLNIATRLQLKFGPDCRLAIQADREKGLTHICVNIPKEG